MSNVLLLGSSPRCRLPLRGIENRYHTLIPAGLRAIYPFTNCDKELYTEGRFSVKIKIKNKKCSVPGGLGICHPPYSTAGLKGLGQGFCHILETRIDMQLVHHSIVVARLFLMWGSLCA